MYSITLDKKEYLNCNTCGRLTKPTDIILCSLCHQRGFCTSPKESACAGRVTSGPGAFLCPNCSKSSGLVPEPIKKREKNGQPSQVVLCIWYTQSKYLGAERFRLAIEGVLIGLGREVLTDYKLLADVVVGSHLVNYVSRAQVKANASLLVCLFTDGLPSFSEPPEQTKRAESGQGCEQLVQLYDTCFPPSAVQVLRSNFKRRTVIQLATGFLPDSEGASLLEKWIYRTDIIDEVIIPTNANFQPARVLGFALNLAMLLYYKGDDISTALPEAWLRDVRVREHTGLLLLSSGESVSAYIWSPPNRPFSRSVQYCRCKEEEANWCHERSGKDGEKGDRYLQYVCGGCNFRIRLWLSPGNNLARIEALGTAYIKCQWPVPALSVSAVFP